jgi:hypothetical protein
MSNEHGFMKLGLLLLAVAVAGCTTKANPASCADDHCNDPARPFCDEDGSIGGKPDTCIAVECMAGEFGTCRGDNALMCNAAGTNFDEVECMYGCSDAAGGCNACNTSDCEKHIIPKYLPNVCNQLAERNLAVSSSSAIDTSNELNCDSVVAQVDGPEICVRHFGTITVDSNQTLTITGPRAIALVADKAIDIRGIIDVSANGTTNGPGGGLVISGMNATSPSGGGGAGFRTNGAPGGSAELDGGAFNGGSARANPASLSQLVGGTRPQGGTIEMGVAGGGGGALTLISCRDTIDVAGMIDAGGGGGRGSYYPNGDFSLLATAAGGGSGGTVVLQGMMINVSGHLYANGGGGGGGNGFPMSNPGADGSRSTQPADGGPGMGGGGNGGAGGASSAIPEVGKKSTTPSTPIAGAGGGSTGFLLTYTPSDVMPMLAPVGVSPTLETNGVVATN